MADVLLSADDLTVIGGPSSISLDVDFGPAGQRGSLIYASNGDPNISSSGVPSDIQPYDLAINISASSSRYLTIYQYYSADGVSSWQELTRLSPNAGSFNLDVAFLSGASVTDGNPGIFVPISAITESTELTPANFNIQYSFESITPIMSSILINPSFIEIDNVAYLAFQINAIEFNGVTLAAVDGVTKKMHFFVTVV